ncbi:LAME_0G00210g1_1 [Lachancea meyersii CBS 8951]|uniref:L-serine ammonia-lyase n=1 Tax=Lachancea meyersii CBS 8951 TaxID=1266667 RepID=A0A1G4K4M6_9SACH|nr:LAME_0G00210g1_1 [Lachancea meyersii CBS 8951]
MAPAFVKTPLLEHTFNCAVNSFCHSTPRFFLKYEFLQPSGSFKSRGIGNLIFKQAKLIKAQGQKIPYVFASSGGNAGLAAATACKMLSIPCSVVVPNTTNPRMVEKIRRFGAKIEMYGKHWKEADAHLRENVMTKMDTSVYESIYAHPFDHPLIWEGHATMVDEIFATLKEKQVSPEKVKAIVCSIGGGGLYNGIIEGLKKLNLEKRIPIVGVETNGCQVLSHSLKSGVQLEFENITSIATSIGTNSISKKTYDNATQYFIRSVVLSDAEVIESCLRFADDTNIITEPACGAALHLAYRHDILSKALQAPFSSDDVVIIIGCGGSATSYDDIKSHWARMSTDLNVL